ncbi:HAD-IIIA family hydrolase [Trichocoleus sp. FACHB-40]|nr:HAD-IIIA family hydrolase [Trichocoleus sp. FACHB-40]
MNLLILDMDGTVRQPLSGNKFIQRPRDQQIIEGVENAIAYFAATGWKIVGVTNQAGVASGKKSLQSCIKEQQYTLELLPEIEEIYFCPDFDGRKWHNYCKHSESGNFRKPNPGMLNLVIQKYSPVSVLMVGDRRDDREAAAKAGVKFQQAESWRQTYGDADV